MHRHVSSFTRTETLPCWNKDDELAHIEDTLRSESLVFDIEHVTDDCTCKGKTCRKCSQKKCCHAFLSDKRRSDGLHSYCRSCLNQVRAAYRRAHPERKCIDMHNYRARKQQAEATLTTQEWLDLKARYDHRCLCCGKQEPEITLTLDHVIPLSQGGPSTIANAQPLCQGCNSQKKDAIIDFRVKE